MCVCEDGEGSGCACVGDGGALPYMKNWEPLVLGPLLAIDRRNGLSCLSLKFSSLNMPP